jgi:hypothetical protein
MFQICVSVVNVLTINVARGCRPCGIGLRLVTLYSTKEKNVIIKKISVER